MRQALGAARKSGAEARARQRGGPAGKDGIAALWIGRGREAVADGREGGRAGFSL